MRNRTCLVLGAWMLVALNGCADVDVDDNSEQVGVAEQAVTAGRELRLRMILAGQLEEGADEIFLTARQRGSSSMNIIRPPGDPDYWRFDTPGSSLTMNQHVGTIVANGENLLVHVMEQDDPPIFPNADLGEMIVFLDGAHTPHFVDTSTVQYKGINENGWHHLRFHVGAIYHVYFSVGAYQL